MKVNGERIKGDKMKEERKQVFIWPSLVAKLVAGEAYCTWAAWFKAHYKYDKIQSNFDTARWNIAHNALLNDRRKGLERLDYRVLIENQNSFKWEYKKDVIISGTPDIVAFGEEEGMDMVMRPVSVIEDAKSGKPKTSHHVQVMFYQIVLPKAVSEYTETKFDGCIIYREGLRNIEIPHAAAIKDESLNKFIFDTLDDIGGPESGCRHVPSHQECKWCDIKKEDCPAKMG